MSRPKGACNHPFIFPKKKPKITYRADLVITARYAYMIVFCILSARFVMFDSHVWSSHGAEGYADYPDPTVSPRGHAGVTQRLEEYCPERRT